MERLERLAKEVYAQPFAKLSTVEQQVLIGIQRNEIETARNRLMDTFNNRFRDKRFAS